MRFSRAAKRSGAARLKRMLGGSVGMKFYACPANPLRLIALKLLPEDKSGRKLLVSSILLPLAWYLWRGAIGWFALVYLALPLLLILGIGIGVLITSIIYLVGHLIRREFSIGIWLPLFIVVIGFVVGWDLPPIPSKPEVVFRCNREEFIRLAESAVATYRTSRKFEPPKSDLYRNVFVTDYDGFIDDGDLARRRVDYSVPPQRIVVEFIIDDFYLPLVFIVDDNPDNVYDTCSRGGVIVSRIEPRWYVCARDWN
ncbi:MAG: hypothetical protein QXO24_01995 [Candidatus Micrarchaeaceae archaeon]